jgi:hypothetical protein
MASRPPSLCFRYASNRTPCCRYGDAVREDSRKCDQRCPRFVTKRNLKSRYDIGSETLESFEAWNTRCPNYCSVREQKVKPKRRVTTKTCVAGDVYSGKQPASACLGRSDSIFTAERYRVEQPCRRKRAGRQQAGLRTH